VPLDEKIPVAWHGSKIRRELDGEMLPDGMPDGSVWGRFEPKSSAVGVEATKPAGSPGTDR
jgi:hypothetical protein